MKKLTFLAVALIVIATSCKKDEKSPTPGTPAVTASGMTATETALLGTWIWDKTEYWNGGSLINLYDPAYCATLHPPSGSYPWIGPATFECKSSISVTPILPCSIFNQYDALYHNGFAEDTTLIGCSGHGGGWYVQPMGYDGCSYVSSSLFPRETVRLHWYGGTAGIPIFPSGSHYYIEVLNSTNLVLTTWDTGTTGTGGLANGFKYYYHK